ncbi:MAG TPA: hypothetical protein VMC84_04865 [Methanocella sp.]|uniref:hypothetical protein n=1 Tax=Methanocella sp. TaxID=2052833 RepID=UPI002C5F2A3A|nr:hypothetical protein [Methanocella sp.]HTY90488.1 hypothetical protein [Methanocella sp.]
MKIQMKRVSITATAVLFAMMLAIPALAMSASAASTGYDQQLLQARYDLVSARVNFATGVYADTATLVANASDLNVHVTRLNSDLGTLKGYASSGGRSGFNSFLTGTVQPDMASGMAALKADMLKFKEWGVSAGTKQQLKADYQARKSTFDQQTDAAIIELGNVRLNYYNDAMSKDDQRMSQLSARGIDVSGMESVKSEAMSSVVTPLQSAISSGNADAVKAELHDKCLGNGQPYSDHFFAKTDLAALTATGAKIGASTDNATIQQQLADANAKLSSAQGTLNVVGTNPYTSDQQSQIWDNLKAASDGLKTILKELNSQNKQG